MGTLSFEIVEDNFVKKSTASYNLSMLISKDRFSFLINDVQNKLLAVRTYTYSKQQEQGLKTLLQSIFVEDSYLQLPYQTIRIAVSNDRFTLIPQRLYDSVNNELYLKNMVDDLDGWQIHSDWLEHLDIHSLFAMEIEVADALLQFFPTSQFHHCNSALILAFHKLAVMREGLNVFLNVQHRRVQVLVFEEDKLLFCNSFNFRHPNDFIYYVMMVFDQFQLKPETVPVGLAGQIVEDSRIYHLLYRYIRHLYKVQAPDYMHFGKQFGNMPRHFYFDLYSLKLCE